MGLTLAKALRLVPRGPTAEKRAGAAGSIVAFTGAGGKTTCLFALAHELERPVIATTTTHLGAWQAPLADRHVIATKPSDLAGLGEDGVTLVTGKVDAEGRLSAINAEVLHELHARARSGACDLLIEADGARQKPLKAPRGNEPNVPPFVDVVAVVVGMLGLGAPLTEDAVHRSELFANVAGLKRGEAINAEAVVKMLRSTRGGLQGIPSDARRVAILNQAESVLLQAQGQGMASELLRDYHGVVVASMQARRVHAVYERHACIVLAAGSATRFGAPKQLMPWHGKPLVRIAAENALEAGLSPVVVVTGAYDAEVRKAVDGLTVQIAPNPDWREGQASSIRCGLAAVPGNSGSVVFLLADQPLITPNVIRALLEAHATNDACIVAPLVEEGKRGNPVLFDRGTFGRLRELRGDVGGRALFAELPIHYVPWHDARIASDIDTQADYKRLVEDQ